jgi:UDP:flavonoid glycosyltransferase YjiC (YdhE family)
VILTTGSQIKPDELGQLPDNFLVKSFYPGSKILEHCDAVICHGGNGTVYQALRAGIPLVTIPTHIDQKANAFLLENQKAGITVDPKNLDRVIPSLKKVLKEPIFRTNASRFKQLISDRNGPELAVQLIEDFLNAKAKDVSKQ